jgi:hypothetical protein
MGTKLAFPELRIQSAKGKKLWINQMKHQTQEATA